MKKLLSVLLALLLGIAAVPAWAETPDADVTAMLPALDSVMRASIRLERGYDPQDRGFFWTTLGLMAANWCREDPLCEAVDGELRVPRLKMQELATAAFAEYSDLLPLPVGDFFVRYDEAWDAYFVALGDAEECDAASVRCSRTQPNDTIDVEVVSQDGVTLKAVLTQNAYADAVSTPVFLYSIQDAELTPEPQKRHSRLISLEGLEERVAECRFVSTAGYALWVPEGVLRCALEDRGDCFVPEDPEAAEVELVIAPAADEEILTGDVRTETLASGAVLTWTEAERAGSIERTYLIELSEMRFRAVAVYPKEAAEGYGARLDEMLRTMEPAA